MNHSQLNAVFPTVAKMMAATALYVAGYVHGETVTLQASLLSDTYCQSSSPNTKYESVVTSITGTPYFYCARDHSSLTRFGVFQWRLPLCPANMRVSEVRLKIYSQAGTGGGGTLGFAALTNNPNLTLATWNTCVADGYITGRSEETYRVLLGTSAVSLAETLTNATSVWRWNTLRSSLTFTSGMTNSLAKHVSDTLSASSSNTLTLLTLPLSGNGLTEWRGGSLEAGSNTVMEIDLVPADIALTVPVTNNLLVALQSSSAMNDDNDGVAIWPDAAALGGWQDFSQIAANDRPVLISANMPNGKKLPVLDFTQANLNHLELGVTPTLETNTLSWFVVFKPDMAGAGTTRALLSSAYTSGAGSSDSSLNYLWGAWVNGTTGDFHSFARSSTGSLKAANFQPTVSNQWFVMSGTWNGRSEPLNGHAAQSLTGRLLAQDRTAYADVTVSDVDALPAGHKMTRIGRLSGIDDASRLFDGQMAEILIYDTALSAADVEAVFDYLDRKYLKRLGTLLNVF